jgi:hypothetical protein
MKNWKAKMCAKVCSTQFHGGGKGPVQSCTFEDIRDRPYHTCSSGSLGVAARSSHKALGRGVENKIVYSHFKIRTLHHNCQYQNKSYKRLLHWNFHPRQSGKNNYLLKNNITAQSEVLFLQIQHVTRKLKRQ